jgi:hypothetical protein
MNDECGHFEVLQKGRKPYCLEENFSKFCNIYNVSFTINRHE